MKSLDRKTEREKLFTALTRLITELGDYPNKSEFERDNLFWQTAVLPRNPSVTTRELQTLMRKIKGGEKQSHAQTLDYWLVEREQMTPFYADMFDALGFDPKSGEIGESLPGRAEMRPTATAGKYEFHDTVDRDKLKENYVERMKLARSIVGDRFIKEKLDLLYSDSRGGPQFEEALTDLKFKLNAARTDTARDEIIDSFYKGLR